VGVKILEHGAKVEAEVAELRGAALALPLHLIRHCLARGDEPVAHLLLNLRGAAETKRDVVGRR